MMQNDRNTPAGTAFFQRSAQALFAVFVLAMIGSFVRWIQTGDALNLRSMGVLLFTAATAAMLLATFADRRGIDISPRWEAWVLRYFTLMFFIALLMIFTLTAAKGNGQGAALTLLIGIPVALLRYKAYQQRVRRGRI